VQVFIEIVYPEKFLQYFLYLARFWGRALLYTLTGVILVVMGGDYFSCASRGCGNAEGATLMLFIIGVMMLLVGVVYLLIAIFSCGKWNPVSLCRRFGKEYYSYD
jgi:hypothetical protein